MYATLSSHTNIEPIIQNVIKCTFNAEGKNCHNFLFQLQMFRNIFSYGVDNICTCVPHAKSLLVVLKHFSTRSGKFKEICWSVSKNKFGNYLSLNLKLF